jgi:hypothetical protein
MLASEVFDMLTIINNLWNNSKIDKIMHRITCPQNDDGRNGVLRVLQEWKHSCNRVVLGINKSHGGSSKDISKKNICSKIYMKGR